MQNPKILTRYEGLQEIKPNFTSELMPEQIDKITKLLEAALNPKEILSSGAHRNVAYQPNNVTLRAHTEMSELHSFE